jgi:hypothetical protein
MTEIKKCLQRGTGWVFKYSSLRFVFKRLNYLRWWRQKISLWGHQVFIILLDIDISLKCFSQTSTLILLMWRIRWAPNSIRIYIQQDATLHRFFISGNCSTHFGWYFHPSSGAHTTVSTAYGICHTVTAVVEELEPVWVCCGWRTLPTAHSTPVPTLPRQQ